MVGVPGRSKGCNTCRRRKKGCDRESPVCGQCRTAGLVCGGYQRELVWRNATQEQINAASSAADKRRMIQLYNSKSHTSPTVTLHPSFARTAREAQYFGLYCSTYLPKGRRAIPLESTRSTPRSWIVLLDKLYSTDDVLKHVVLALSTSMLAVESGDAHLKVKGLQTYTNSVRQMAMAIRDTKRANSDAVIAAVKLAVCYEILFGLDGDQYEQMGRISQIVGWYGHVDGQLALFQQRGPEALVSGPGHRLFVGGRLDLVLVSISRRKRSPLSASRWMTQPWELIPKSKMDEIVDILIEITGHIEDLDILRAHAGDVATADELRDTLVYRCMQTYRTLVAWTETVGDALYAFDPNVVGLPLPTPSTDEDYELLHLSIVYWITSLFLYSTWEFALQQNIQPSYLTTGVSCIDSPPHLDSPQSDTQISDTSSINYARRIAWSIHLFFAPGTGAWGANAALLPLGFALRFLMVKESGSPFSEERKLLVSCFKKPFMGTFVGRFLRNFQEEESHPDLRNIPGIQGMEMRARSWWLKGYGT